ncbi:MAG: hypothetical protein V2A58_13855 [Planctomycetota bacterium]
MDKIALVCPRCGFAIEIFTQEMLDGNPQKRKRHKYLMTKSNICPSCLSSGRLEEVRGEKAVAAEKIRVKAVEPAHAEAEGKRGETPLCDELERGPWPSHVTQLKSTSYTLGMYEEALRLGHTQWDYGGYVSLPGVAAGVLVRASTRPEITKGSNFIRIMDPCGNFFRTDKMRQLIEIAERRAYGLLHMLSTGGDLELLGIPTHELASVVEEVNKIGFDVGSTGDDFRTSEECIGPAKCDLALIDTLGLRQAWYDRFLDDIQYPRFPHKIKVKIAGCPNDCVRSTQKADIALVGVFRDSPRILPERLAAWRGAGGDLATVCGRCPGRAMKLDGSKLAIDGEACIHCMNCANKVDGIVPGEDRGVAVLVGGKMRGKYGPMLGRLVVPFLPARPPEYREVFDFLAQLADVYDENARKKERFGDFIYRIGFDRFLELAGVEPGPENISQPRTNLFIHWTREELAADIAERKARCQE